MAGPLTGVNVLEFSQVIAAPFGGQALADMGASVLKVEPPEGDSWRLQLSFAPLESKTFQCLNRGKDSIALRLNLPEAQKIVHQLIPETDVVLINYRPDVPKKFNIDYESLAAIRPDLIYVDLTAFGRQGPWALRPGYDGAIQAVSGLMAAEGKTRPGEGSPMTISSTAVADFSSGIAMADAVTTALYHRQMTGEGQMVECSLLATALNLQLPVIMEHPLADGKRNAARDVRRRRARQGASFQELLDIRRESIEFEEGFEKGFESNYFYRPFLTLDGVIVVAAETEGQKEALRKLFSLAPTPPQHEIEQMISTIGTSDSTTIMGMLISAGIPTAPAHYPEEMIDDETVLANEWLMELHHDVTGSQQQMKLNLEFSETRCDEPDASPPLGRDSDKVLANLGYDQNDIARMRQEGVIL